MTPALAATVTVREAYIDSEDVPTIVLHGVADFGPFSVHLKGSALDLEGVTIGQPVELSIDPDEHAAGAIVAALGVRPAAPALPADAAHNAHQPDAG